MYLFGRSVQSSWVFLFASTVGFLLLLFIVANLCSIHRNRNDYAVFRLVYHRCIWRCQYQYFLIVTNQKHRYLLAFFIIVCARRRKAEPLLRSKPKELFNETIYVHCPTIHVHKIGIWKEYFVENNANNLHWIDGALPYLTNGEMCIRMWVSGCFKCRQTFKKISETVSRSNGIWVLIDDFRSHVCNG